MSRGRVLVATDRIGELDSLAAGTALASGFARVADVAVLPVGAGGKELAAAVGALSGTAVHVDGPGWWVASAEWVVIGYSQPQRPAWQPEASTADVGSWVRRVLAGCPQPEVVLDLTGITAHDAGAGLLAEAGTALAGRRVTGLVPVDELAVPASGATGMLARRAHGAGVDLADLLAADASLHSWADAVAPGLAGAPGSGASGGSALVVLANGGELTSPTQFCYRLSDAGKTISLADLVVTGCTELSALDRGGEVVAAVAGWASTALRPCIAFSTGTALARRELRTFGLEAAHQLPCPVAAGAVTEVAARIAGGWFPGVGGHDVH